MLGFGMIFLTVALVAGMVGFGGFVTAAAGLAQTAFLLAVGGFTLSVLIRLYRT